MDNKNKQIKEQKDKINRRNKLIRNLREKLKSGKVERQKKEKNLLTFKLLNL